MIAGTTTAQEMRTPAIIIDGVLFFYDYCKETVISTNKFRVPLVDIVFSPDKHCLNWFKANVEIANVWTKREDKSKDNKGPKLISYDKWCEKAQ